MAIIISKRRGGGYVSHMDGENPWVGTGNTKKESIEGLWKSIEHSLRKLSPMPLFNPEMRKANREGIKTQTRRILKLPAWSTGQWDDFELESEEQSIFNLQQDPYAVPLIICKSTGCLAEIRCPYGYLGELRYVREPLFKGEDGYAYYVDDDGSRLEGMSTMAITSMPSIYPNAQRVQHLVTGEKVKWNWKIATLSSTYMPKYAARTFKRIKFVRVERLREISPEDCMAEGIVLKGQELEVSEDAMRSLYVIRYAQLWNSLNAKRGYPWESNPFVWVIGYESWTPGQ